MIKKLIRGKMKIDFAKEITKCFMEQYPEKAKDYMKLISGEVCWFEKKIEVYDDMLKVFPFLLNIILKLKQ